MTIWKKIILFENKTEQYQIYCDLDGVLVNFEKGIMNALNSFRLRYLSNPEYFQTLIPNKKNKDYILFKLIKRVEKKFDLLKPFKSENVLSEYPDADKDLGNLMYEMMKDDSMFWSELDWAPGGKELWSFISSYKPIILSTGTDKESEIGKKSWCEKHLLLSGDRVIITPDKGVNTGNKTGILIDDRDKSLNQFNGIKIKYYTGNYKLAIEELNKLGFI